MLPQKMSTFYALVCSSLVAACDSQRPAVLAADGNVSIAARQSVQSNSQEDDEWEYLEEVDPITKTTSRTAKFSVNASDLLMADIEFYCGPKRGMFGFAPLVVISTYDRRERTEDSIGGAPINEEGEIEYRFNGKSNSYSLSLFNQVYSPLRFSNEVTITFKQLAGGLYGVVKDDPIYVEDPNFVVRVPTNVGTLTQQISLDIPSIKEVLTSCGVTYGSSPVLADRTDIVTTEKATAETVSLTGSRIDEPTAEVSRVAPSFDCTKAATYAERAICSRDDLAEMDVRISTKYRALLHTVADTSTLRQTQRDWIKSRNQCTDPSCLLIAHEQRLAELAAE